jgi:CheY-like chemotaxis protein
MNNSHCPTILLVEDNMADITLMKESISYLRLEVNLLVISDGSQVEDFLQRRGIYRNIKKPDLIILDINLPGKNGFEILQEIRSSNPKVELPVVVLTSSRHEEDILLAFKLHANAVLSKPSDFLEFTSLIKSINDKYLNNGN